MLLAIQQRPEPESCQASRSSSRWLRRQHVVRAAATFDAATGSRGSRPGYGVGGHPFLSDLPADERRAVLEYLKTL